MLTHEQIINYLSRLNLPKQSIADMTANSQTLKKLHYHHLLAIPFENLDIHLGNPISLELKNVYQKIIIHQRGGFCYELNYLFYALLNSLGYHCQMLSAKVYNKKQNDYGVNFDHMALMVVMDDLRYLLDVGFGDLSLLPLNIDDTSLQFDGSNHFCIQPFGNDYQLNQIDNQDIIVKYLFSTKSHHIDEFLPMCHYHQSSPNSFFTQKRVVSKACLDGRITLLDNTLKITSHHKTSQQKLSNEREYNQALWDYFGIQLVDNQHNTKLNN